MAIVVAVAYSVSMTTETETDTDVKVLVETDTNEDVTVAPGVYVSVAVITWMLGATDIVVVSVIVGVGNDRHEHMLETADSGHSAGIWVGCPVLKDSSRLSGTLVETGKSAEL